MIRSLSRRLEKIKLQGGLKKVFLWCNPGELPEDVFSRDAHLYDKRHELIIIGWLDHEHKNSPEET